MCAITNNAWNFICTITKEYMPPFQFSTHPDISALERLVRAGQGAQGRHARELRQSDFWFLFEFTGGTVVAGETERERERIEPLEIWKAQLMQPRLIRSRLALRNIEMLSDE
jgi:hypothetical protein